MKIVVTGCAGFVGSHVVDALLLAGHTVVGLDDLSGGVNFNRAIQDDRGIGTSREGFSFVGADIRDRVAHFLASADAVVHAAAYPNLRSSWLKDEGHFERVKVFERGEVATRSLLEQMPEKAALVYLSSASVYGGDHDCDGNRPGTMPTGNRPGARAIDCEHCGGPGYDEDTALPSTQESPYSASKLACESYVSAWSHKAGRRWHVLRLVNAVGARSHRGVIADFVRMARATGKVHAADNGDQTKNWVHVEDVAGAVLAALHRGVLPDAPPAMPSGIYNVTSEARVSWWQIVGAMGLKPGDITFEDRDRGAVGDPHDLHVSGEKLAPWYRCEGDVRHGIHEALAGLGWQASVDYLASCAEIEGLRR